MLQCTAKQCSSGGVCTNTKQNHFNKRKINEKLHSKEPIFHVFLYTTQEKDVKHRINFNVFHLFEHIYYDW